MTTTYFCRYGDYPKLADRSQHERDPWYKWDHPDLRRNWGEPVRRLFVHTDMVRQHNKDTKKNTVGDGVVIGILFFCLFV